MTEPAAKKQKTNNLPVFDRVAADAEMRTLLRKQASALKHLKSSQEQEAETLKEKHDKAEREARLASTRVEAGTESDEYVCGTCAKAFSGDLLEDDSIEASHFQCEKCSEHHCNEHKDDMTMCVACSATYCQNCLDTMNKCNGCILGEQLTCCNLKKMPCGEYESGDCEYYHHKRCRCQRSNDHW